MINWRYVSILLSVISVWGVVYWNASEHLNRQGGVRDQAREISRMELRDQAFTVGYGCTMNALDELGRDADVEDVYRRAYELRAEMWGY